MRVIRSVVGMQRWSLDARSRGVRIALVPTMGFLHEGHMSLVRAARRRVGPHGVVVLSLFVNPTQFGPGEDLDRYPRDFRSDRQRCHREGVDILFAPTAMQVYAGMADGRYSTYVVENALAEGMEGEARPGHFRGVATVVAKLFNMVLPDTAVFGAKDYQQSVVIRRMASNLNFPVSIHVSPTYREADGLAMSSRNAYLTPEERGQAAVLWRAIQAARREVAAREDGLPVPVSKVRAVMRKVLARASLGRVDYLSFFDEATLRPVRVVGQGTRVALAVFFGRTRLIDNAALMPSKGPRA